MEYSLFSLDGTVHSRVQLAAGAQTIKLDFLPAGLYVVQLISENGRSQFIKVQKE
jgi:hypothetical protein